jgi:hypothetical protein
MTLERHAFFDTDMLIHSRCIDEPVRRLAIESLSTMRPNAISSFSLVEIKGAYIQRLKLLRGKVADSPSYENMVARIQNSGDRACNIMMAQLTGFVIRLGYSFAPWNEAKNQLLCLLDAHLGSAYDDFNDLIDYVHDDLECTRAWEEPFDIDNDWNVVIPRCTNQNAKCNLHGFLQEHSEELGQLRQAINQLDVSARTDELDKIASAIDLFLADPTFPLSKWKCRNVGDLLIGLQTIGHECLVSSNYKEHCTLSEHLGYDLELFPLVAVRSK